MIKKLIVKVYYLFKYRINPVRASRDLGVNLGRRCRLIGRIDWGSEPYLISIGDHVSVTSSQFVTHDGGVWIFRDSEPDIDAIAPIKIGSNVFIGMGCVILPGTEIGDNVVVGAGSIVRGRLAPNFVYAGVPVRQIKTISEYRKSIERRIFLTKQLAADEKKKILTNRYYE